MAVETQEWTWPKPSEKEDHLTELGMGTDLDPKPEREIASVSSGTAELQSWGP